MIASDGPKKGKIVRVGEHGEPDLEAKIYDLSITKTVFAIFVSSILIIIIFVSVARSYKRRRGMAPKGLQSFLEAEGIEFEAWGRIGD